MQYIILIIGIILIYFSLNSKKYKNIFKEEAKSDFDSIVENSPDDFYEREIIKSYIEIENRIIKLEEKIASLEENIQIKDKEFNIFYENIRKDVEIYNQNNHKKENGFEEKNIDKYLNGNLTNKPNDKDEDITLLSREKVKDNINDQVNVQNTIKNKKILSLYNEGRSVEEIASSLKMGKGEILLRIGLQKKGK